MLWPLKALFHSQDTSNYTTAQLLLLQDRPILMWLLTSSRKLFRCHQGLNQLFLHVSNMETNRDWRITNTWNPKSSEPGGLFLDSPLLCGHFRCKATENFNFLQPKNLKMILASAPTQSSRRWTLIGGVHLFLVRPTWRNVAIIFSIFFFIWRSTVNWHD